MAITTTRFGGNSAVVDGPTGYAGVDAGPQ